MQMKRGPWDKREKRNKTLLKEKSYEEYLQLVQLGWVMALTELDAMINIWKN